MVAVVVNSTGHVLAFERSDLAGQWQLPQGGIDVGETPVVAAWRELQEETGLSRDDVELIDEYPEWTAYEWPEAIRAKGRMGQVQRWFTFRVVDDAVVPTPDDVEFRAWQWADRQWLTDNVVEFRRPSYQRVLLR